MVNCCVASCPSNAAHAEISFFRFPVIRADDESRRLSMDRRVAWIVAVDRKNINFDYALVCSRHFISGRPAKLHEYRHPDWIPTLELKETSKSDASASVIDIEDSIQSSVLTIPNKHADSVGKQKTTKTKSDTSNICRLCLGKEVRLTKPFKDEHGTDDALLQKIYECTTVKITLKVRYPSSICAICDTKLTEFSRFRERCIENDVILRTLLDTDDDEEGAPPDGGDTEPLQFTESSDIKDLQLQLYGSSDETTVSQSEFAGSDKRSASEASVPDKQPATNTVTQVTVIFSNEDIDADLAEAKSSKKPVPVKTPEAAAAKDKPKLPTISVKPLSSLAASNVVSPEQPTNDSAVGTTHKDGDKSIPGSSGLECLICARPFRNSYTLKRHMNLHTEENLFTCEYCGKKFNDRSNWKIHLRAHTGDNLLRCAVCFKTFISPSTLKYHLRAHRKLTSFDCRICVDVFNTYEKLSDHVNSNHGAVRLEELSKSNDDSFVAGDFLKIEMEADETTLTAAIPGLAEAVEAGTLPEPPPLTPAPVAAPVQTFSELPGDITIKKEITDEDEIEIKQEPIDETLEPDPDGAQQQLSQLLPTQPDEDNDEEEEEESAPVILFRCDYCMKIFKYLYELRVHMKQHNGTSGPPSEEQKKKQPSKVKPATVVLPVESPPSKKPRHPSIDEDVGELVNAPLPEHKCDKCNKCFRTEELLKVHVDTHKMDDDVTQARSCKVCFKTFKCELNLVSHMRKHHPYETFVSEQSPSGIDDKPQSPDSSSNDGNLSQAESAESSSQERKCEICALSFHCAYKLEQHVLEHFQNNEAVAFVPSADRPYKCTECHKRFKRKDYLLIHIRTHTGERRHKCDMCSSAFVHPSNLITHRKLHSNERPFKCDLCPAAFKLYAGLKIHRKRCLLKYLQENSVTMS